jgi:DNA modification methylase
VINLINADCFEALKDLPENSIDTCITDPPYALGFMGKEWDSFGSDAGKFQEWSRQWAQEVYRVLKPGGLLLSFGGTRTYHRMACGIEDAEFEIRDCFMWVYGCLSEDTEILTINGWMRYNKNIKDYPVLCYNVVDDTFGFYKPTEVYCYENKHTAYRIQSGFTDQIVSRNHRCLVERSGRKVFAYAETLQCEENIPVLESLQDLPETIYDNESHSSIEKSLLQLLCEAPTQKEKATTGKDDDPNNLPNLWERILHPFLLGKQKCKSLLFSKLCGKSKGRAHETNSPSWKIGVDRTGQAQTQRGDARRKESRLERRSNLLQKAWELCWRKVCAMSARIFGYGSQGWLCYGTSPDNGGKSGASAIEDGSSASYKSRPIRQSSGKSDTFREQSSPQVIRITRAKVTPFEYDGKMWCVTVPTGAFVARRNGKIFITGNSGFPKSYNISKGIEGKLRTGSANWNEWKGLGGEPYKSKTGYVKLQAEQKYRGDYSDKPASDVDITTTEAQLWDGWGTQLKPAYEPVVIAQKPVDQNYVNNALTWGVAGYWIDGGRIKTSEIVGARRRSENESGKTNMLGVNKQIKFGGAPTQGRYPSNFAHDGSDEVMALFPETGKSTGGRIGNKGSMLNMTGTNYEAGDAGYGDDGSAARFFYCAKASRSERNAGLEESNPHPTVKPLALMRYLVRLTKTPTGGVVLDPFMGSGTTGCACVLEGRDFIGIEKEAEYYEISQKRIEHYRLPLDKAQAEK